jgi:hypothetical protein
MIDQRVSPSRIEELDWRIFAYSARPVCQQTINEGVVGVHV